MKVCTKAVTTGMNCQDHGVFELRCKGCPNWKDAVPDCEACKRQVKRDIVLELDKAGMLYHKCCELVGGKPGAYTSDDCPACKLIRELK